MIIIVLVKTETQRWIEMAEYDLGSAEATFRARRYLYTILACHLCLEKMLKACVVELGGMEIPPYTHNLRRLAELAGVTLPPPYEDFIAELTPQGVAARYPESIQAYDRKTARRYLDLTKEVYAWLRQLLTSSAS
ncbi:MAG: HEPN domain-containing protein [Actinobacteria bacterium]|nr:HEPN domain-containing protein [Actinomycetota bacterium]